MLVIAGSAKGLGIGRRGVLPGAGAQDLGIHLGGRARVRRRLRSHGLASRRDHLIGHLTALNEALGRFLEQALVRHAQTIMKDFRGPTGTGPVGDPSKGFPVGCCSAAV